MAELVLLLVLGTTIWVGVDAARLGVRRGMLGSGVADMGVFGWVVCCLLLWIVAFPVYLVTRERYARPARGPEHGTGVASYPSAAWPGVPSAPASSYAWSSTARPAVGSSASPSTSVSQELERLVSLRGAGYLSDVEFTTLKRRLIDG